jgi:hypothetical protein
MFGNVLGVARWFAFGSDIRIKMRTNPVVASIVSDPRIKEKALSIAFGAAIQAELANARLAAHSVSG